MHTGISGVIREGRWNYLTRPACRTLEIQTPYERRDPRPNAASRKIPPRRREWTQVLDEGFYMSGQNISTKTSESKVRKAAIVCLAVIIAGALGCRTRQAPNDQAITAAVRAKLHAEFAPLEDNQVAQLERGADSQTVSYINVSSVNGVVTLTGEVPSQRAKNRAGEIARSVKDVVAVHDNLAIGPRYSDDAPVQE
jgi:hypothetical protein